MAKRPTIAELQEQIKIQQDITERFIRENTSLKNQLLVSYETSPTYQTQLSEITRLEAMRDHYKSELDNAQEIINQLQKELKTAQDQLSAASQATELPHNARGAGRKRHDAKWTAKQEAVIAAIAAGESMEQILQHLGISRSTYFRLKSQK